VEQQYNKCDDAKAVMPAQRHERRLIPTVILATCCNKLTLRSFGDSHRRRTDSMVDMSVPVVEILRLTSPALDRSRSVMGTRRRPQESG
jgi:hypothetical protein